MPPDQAELWGLPFKRVDDSRSLSSPRFSSAQFPNHFTESKTWIWFRTHPEVSPGHRVLSWSSSQQPIPSQTKLTGFDKPKICETLPFYWALRIKATAEVTGKGVGGKARKQKTPKALSNSCVSLEVCLALLFIKGIRSYLTGLPWRHFISVILNSFWKEGQGLRCACQMQINSR